MLPQTKNGDRYRSPQVLIGRGERIRTSDLTVPNRALYQAEPRPDICDPNTTLLSMPRYETELDSDSLSALDAS